MHVGVALTFLFVSIVLSVLFTHPAFLGGLLLVSLFALSRQGKRNQFVRLLPWIGPAVLIYAGINALFNHAGATVLWRGPWVPLIGRLDIRAEALWYGADMALRLIVVTACFAAYTAWCDADQAFVFFARVAGKSALITILAAKWVPQLAAHWQQSADVLRSRGARLDRGSWLRRLRARSPLITALVYSSLDGAWQTAEAMEARAYGSGVRTFYQTVHLTWRDVISFLFLLGALIVGIYAYVTQIAVFVFYPQMDQWVFDRYTWSSLIGLTGCLAAVFIVYRVRTVDQAEESLTQKHLLRFLHIRAHRQKDGGPDHDH